MAVLSDQFAAITGATSGLGRALSYEIAENGGNIILLGRDEQKLFGIQQDLKMRYPSQTFMSFGVDVKNNNLVKSVFDAVLGQLTIDILINCAGIIVKKNLEDTTEEEIHNTLDTNLKGMIFCTKAILPVMKINNRGKIVNISSTQGKHARAQQSVYAASKFGVKGFTEALQKELADTNVHVYGIYPGGMRTELFSRAGYTPDNADTYMDPFEVAKIIVFAITRPVGVFMDDVVISRRYPSSQL